MNKNDKVKAGYWSVATQKHLKVFRADSCNIDEFDNLDLSGKAGMFLGTIRGNGTITNINKIEKMANTVGIKPRELRTIILPEIEKYSDKKIEILRSSTGDIEGIQEYIFSNKEVLEISGNIFENQNSRAIERITIETMDKTKKIPYLENEIKDILIKDGFKEKDVEIALQLQNQFKLINILQKGKSNEKIISNEYIWGSNHEKIALAVSNLDMENRNELGDIISVIQNSQGYPIEKLNTIDNNLIKLAKKTGMIDPTTIISSRSIRKEFGFTPNLIDGLEFEDDILDDLKLFLASIRFGENYTQHTTIIDPEAFLKSLIRNGEIGPHDANACDYTLLEKKGIVKVEKKSKYNHYLGRNREGYFLKLIKDDVAKKALEIIKNPKYSINIEHNNQTNYDIINNTGNYLSPEEVRINIGKSPEIVAEAEAYLTSVLRDETIL
ncbi:hypothetical protein CYK73_15255 [Clostridium perfringens]|uniref:Uncharacterized protein n=3 Tax=Clostridium perfringens TaxID=1502 RepID=G5DSB8_CLOPF|nr:hypothetical protein [Clostridium perfringens]AEP94959.1 hypothetical protein pBeta2_00069 [Clostridium perfringens]AWS27212.1 hypothetical protein CYK96_16515 [Clostridium perfringens]MBO3304557.1 hypothetical protein [Clostridium perfringens]MBO3307865.1 hypothetical protein [Clostridium perfringens]MBO3311196.1 hypothetical protein [Clostridium perfringens]